MMRHPAQVFKIAIGLVLVSATLFAQTNTFWTGTDGNWTDVSNWSNGVPNGNFTALITGVDGEIIQDLPGLSIWGMELLGEMTNLVLDNEMSITQTFAWDGSTISGPEEINILGHATILSGVLNTTINNFGRIDLLSGTVFSTAGGTGGATWNNHPGGLTVFEESTQFGNSPNQIGTFNNAAGATVHQLQNAASAMIWDVVNDGVIKIENNAQILFVNGFVQHPSGTLLLKGNNSTADMFGPSQIEGRIEGDGTVISSIELDGVISPGQPVDDDPIGSMEIAGNLLMMPDSILEFDIGAEADSISITHNLILDGTIQLTAREGLVPGTYTLIAAGQQLIPGGLKLGPLPNGVDASLVIDEQNREVNLVVVSVETSVVPESIDVTSGVIRSGSVSVVALSDDVDLSIARDQAQIQSFVDLTTKGVTSNQAPTSFTFVLEASVFARGTINQSIELYNFATNEFELVDSRSASRFSDQITTLKPSGDLSRFVEPGTGCMEAKIKFNSNINRQQFSANIDQIVWHLE